MLLSWLQRQHNQMGLPQNEVVAQDQVAPAVEELNFPVDDVDEGLGDDERIQEGRCVTVRIDALNAPSTCFCSIISKVTVTTVDGAKSLCTSCYMLYIYNIGVGWHQHTDTHMEGLLRELLQERCNICNKMLGQLRLASVCYMCNNNK